MTQPLIGRVALSPPYPPPVAPPFPPPAPGIAVSSEIQRLAQAVDEVLHALVLLDARLQKIEAALVRKGNA